jgi:four helix bundle protein
VPEIRSFRDLNVYRIAQEQAGVIFTLTQQFPKQESYSLSDQIRRSSRAVSAIIAEGWARRRYEADFVNKMTQALGEAMETQAWLDHALNCQYIDQVRHAELDDHWQHTGGMLRRMVERSQEFCGNRRAT